MQKFAIALSLAAVATLTGCGAGHKINTVEVEKVRSVAVVGYLSYDRIERDQGAGGMLGKVNATSKMASTMDGTVQNRMREQGQQVYELVRERVATTTGWKVLGRQELSQNAAYQALYTEEMSKNGAMLQRGWQRDAEGVLWDVQAQQLSSAQLNKLMDELHVDALAVATVTYVTGKQSGVSIGGVGKRAFHPKAQVTLKLYNKSSDEPIWVAHSTGKATEEGLKTTLGIDDFANETKLFVEAGQSALEKLALNKEEK